MACWADASLFALAFFCCFKLFSYALQSDLIRWEYISCNIDSSLPHSGIWATQILFAARYRESPVLPSTELATLSTDDQISSSESSNVVFHKSRFKDLRALVLLFSLSNALTTEFTFAITASASAPISIFSTPTVAIWYDCWSSFSISANTESSSAFLSLQIQRPPLSLSTIQKESIQPSYFC